MYYGLRLLCCNQVINNLVWLLEYVFVLNKGNVSFKKQVYLELCLNFSL